MPEHTWRRAYEIAPEEVAEAALLVLSDQITLEREDLELATARALGFERNGSEVTKAMKAGVDVLIQTGSAVESDGGVRLSKGQ